MPNASNFLYQPPGGNVTAVTDVFNWINGTVSNFFFPGILIVTYFIILIKMVNTGREDVSKSFSAASFIVMILAVFCRVLNFINTGFMTIFIVLTGVGIAWMYLRDAA